MTNRTRPSGEPGGVPSGTPTRIEPKDDAETTRGTMRENETAGFLASIGYNVEQRPSVTGRKKPDYKIEGRIFDCYAPITDKAYNIADLIREKVERGQADRIVLNLDDSEVDIEELRQQRVWSKPVDRTSHTPVAGSPQTPLRKGGNRCAPPFGRGGLGGILCNYF
ncbi:MAG: hypothetical protein AB4352_29005 [Hormoscilla sp.]